MATAQVRVGCAGWSLPRELQDRFDAGASHLARYATRFDAAEINSSFHRSHAPWVWQRWADAVPPPFRFSVKLPKAITHERRLVEPAAALDDFMGQAGLLGAKLGALLVQLPPSLAFDEAVADRFLTLLRERFVGSVALEPRHASWFAPAADALLSAHRVARVLADPVRHAAGAAPGGWDALVYVRLHGSPRTYYSAYDDAWLRVLAARIRHASQAGQEVWCVFDNTASGAAVGNALSLQQFLQEVPP